jgi:multidrug resistance efflux pump
MICLSRSVRFMRRLTSHVPAILSSQQRPSWGDLPAYISFAIVATGNFTKVGQRVPVKIVFPEQPYLDRLRPGFSAVVTVHTGNAGGR